MQRHRKYLVITIWISTIAFIGAGFVGWGQYNYGSKASAVAKVGNIDITTRELQNAYSSLYSRYNQLFQGNFDEAQAKSFGLDKMALKQLIDQALILNLAEEYGLLVSDKELLDAIATQKAFFKEGSFDKETYQKVLAQNNLSVKEYEEDVRRSLLIQKSMSLFPQTSQKIETEALAALSNITDKISYKLLSADMVTVTPDDEALKAYWESRKNDYMTQPGYTLAVVTQEPLSEAADEAALQEYYTANRTEFTDSEGKILDFDAAKPAVLKAVNSQATHKAALRQYIAFKKEKLDEGTTVETLEVTADNHPFTAELFKEITSLTPAEPYLKPRKVGDAYKSIKLVATKPSEPKSFEAAKEAVRAAYVAQEKQTRLEELAKNSVETFNGTTTPFITRDYAQPLEGMSSAESKHFVDAVYSQQKKRGYITLDNTKIVLFHILEQQLLKTPQTDLEDAALRMKSTLLNSGLLKLLESKYATEIYIEGL